MPDSRPEASPVLVNANPRPRVLVHGFDEAIVGQLLDFIPTVRRIDSLDEVRQQEWDAIATRSNLTGCSPHLFALVQVPEGIAAWTVEALSSVQRVSAHAGHVAEELLRYSGLSDRLAQLTHEVLEPIVNSRRTHTYLKDDSPPSPLLSRPRAVSSKVQLQTLLRPFLATADKRVLAGSYARAGGAQVWVLPADVPDIVPWFRAAIAEWHSINADRFPGLPDWSHESQWQTHAERQSLASLEMLSAERRHIVDYLDRRAADIRRELEAARADADLYERALLTTDSGALVAAVMKALRELGFAVKDADEDARPGDHLEDLHITDPSQPGWVAIAEVKGYSKGAATAAFQQLARFSKRYHQRTGISPTSEWYIVNQFRKQDPSTRQPILHGKEEDVQTFADDNGLVVDTAVLFHVLEQVRAGSCTTTEARDHFRNSVGVLGTLVQSTKGR